MSFHIKTSNGMLLISTRIQGVARHAQCQADLTVRSLDATGLFSQRPAFFPAGFLLELGAVLELGLWELRGLHPYLTSDLPSFREAADDCWSGRGGAPGF